MKLEDLIPPESIGASKDASIRTSTQLNDENTRQNNSYNVNSCGNACGELKSTKITISPSHSKVTLRSSLSENPLHGSQSTFTSAEMTLENPEPQPKRRKVTPQPDGLEIMKQGTLLWDQRATFSSASSSLVSESVQNDGLRASHINTTIQTQPDEVDLSRRSEPPPKKIMKLRTDGRLVTPPKKEALVELVKGRRKPGSSKKQQLVVIKYGSDQASRREIGEKISKILSGELRIKPVDPALSQTVSKSVYAAPTTPPQKSTHPFFLTQQNQDLQTLHTSSPSKSIGGISKTSIPHTQSNNTAIKASHAPLFTAPAQKLRSSPDAKESLWPPEGFFHVRNLSPSLKLIPGTKARTLCTSEKKSKKVQLLISPNEDVLSHLMELVSNPRLPERAYEDAGFLLPKRHIALRSKIPGLVLERLTQNRQPDMSSEDVSQLASSKSMKFTSVAAERLFNTLSTASSAFDQFRCEHREWTNKYSPKTTIEILQSPEEMQLLKDWLLDSSIQSTTTIKSTLSMQIRKSLKRRKQRSELDDFIATSDEEEESDLYNVRRDFNLDAKPSYSERQSLDPTRYSPLRNFNYHNSKSTSAVIISGPTGCGKTSAVHAIARELGFEIFEINPGNRRSGRDILEKVGDMTKNHLVSQGSVRPRDDNEGDNDMKTAADQTLDVINVREEIASGKQSTMQSFFKSQLVNKPYKKNSKKSPQAIQTKSDAETEAKKPNKPQKQSLILLEEVDILFEEDKQFWGTVIALITTSKRPVIMTCNDESLLPLGELVECSVLRMKPPPDDVAADYLLLIAAHEGHLLEKNAISRLYQQKGSDLRASIMQLNIWCQMAINDPTGGLDWMLLPQDYGNTNSEVWKRRVLSEDAFLSYTDDRSFNSSATAPNIGLYIQEWYDEICKSVPEAQDLPSSAIGSVQDALTRFSPGHDQLDISDLIYDTLSACDIQSFVLDGRGTRGTLFPPPLSDHRRESSYTINPPLLQVPSEGSAAYSGSHLGLDPKDNALKILRNSSFDPSLMLDFAMPYQKIDACKSTFPAHPYYIREALDAALDPVTKLSDHSALALFVDVAPYTRSIVSYDLRLKHERARLSDLLSDSFRQGKRQRTTRASRAALEGGHKSSTRRERWFPIDLDFSLIMETGGQDWQEITQKQYTKASRRQKWIQETESLESEDELCQ